MPDYFIVLLNSIFSFLYLFVIAKLLGKKQVAQLTVVDYVIGISIGSIGAQWCTDADNPWYFYAIGMGMFFALSLVFDFLERKLPFKKLLKGKAVEILSDGKFNYDNLKKSKLDVSDILGLCRTKNYFDLSSIAYIFLETNGDISILPTSKERPVKVSDLVELDLSTSNLATYLIIDGNVVSHSLEQLKKNEQWLFKKCNVKSNRQLNNILLAQYIKETDSFVIHYKKIQRKNK